MDVATAPTVYGIETSYLLLGMVSRIRGCNSTYRLRYWNKNQVGLENLFKVATAPTVYGIETSMIFKILEHGSIELQQHLPFTVLKLADHHILYPLDSVATAPTVYGIETALQNQHKHNQYKSCNSTYRLRYWNALINLLVAVSGRLLQQHLPFTVLKPCHDDHGS